jgi:lipoprotein-anchoring transpeptidase ErfK/SrfK
MEAARNPWRARARTAVLAATICCAALIGPQVALGARQGAAALAGSTPPPVASTPASAAPGQIKLVIQHAFGHPPFAIAGGRIVVRGIVLPFIAGQRVKLSFYRDGRKVNVSTAAVQDLGNGAGQLHVSFSSARTGVVQVHAVHYATAQQAQFTARSSRVHFASPSLSSGSRGPSVRVLQSELRALHYVVPMNGVFDEATGRAVIAFRKLTGLARVSSTDRAFFRRLQHGGGAFRVRYRRDGRHVEADLTRQVLAEIEPSGRVHAIYEMSSGKPSTPTVVGNFRVYSKTPGVNAKGMVDSNYFIRGYAIHGYAEVPVYAASHGCLRVPIPNAAAIFAWVRLGTPVDVYNESGGGSRHVRSHAGP